MFLGHPEAKGVDHNWPGVIKRLPRRLPAKQDGAMEHPGLTTMVSPLFSTKKVRDRGRVTGGRICSSVRSPQFACESSIELELIWIGCPYHIRIPLVEWRVTSTASISVRSSSLVGLQDVTRSGKGSPRLC